LDPGEYETWAQQRHTTVFAAVTGVPRILFVKECPYLEPMAVSGADVVSLGVRHDLAAARAAYPDLVFQGNVDEELLCGGTPVEVAEATRRCVRAGGGPRPMRHPNPRADPPPP